MREKIFLLLLQTLEVAVASQCWQGATFSEAVVSPAVESSGILRVPGVASLPQCVAACCDLPGYNLAWMFEGRCYILSCQQKENCQPRERPGTDSILAFLRRASPQTLVLQSLFHGKPYGGRWKPLPQSSEAPGDLDALKDLALFDGAHQDFSEPGTLDVDYPEGSEERGRVSENREGGAEGLTDQSSTEGGVKHNPLKGVPERPPTESSPAQNRALIQVEQHCRHVTPAIVMATSDEHRRRSSENKFASHLNYIPLDQQHTLTHRTQRSNQRFLTGPFTCSTDTVQVVLSAVRAPPTTQHLAWTLTSDPATINTPTTTSVAPEHESEVRGSNRGPVAIVGPDRMLSIPVSSLLLDGSGSTDDHAIISYHWDTVSGPPGLKLEGGDQAAATATGLRVGRYTFRLTVTDQEGAMDSASLTVRIQEARSLPPVAHASGSHTLTLPNNSLVLRGSVTDGDQAEVHYLWVRDSQSPAAGDVLYDSETQASLYLSSLVEGTYLFQLRVTDAQGRSSSATATVEVRPEPGGGGEVELEMLVSVSQVSVAQRDTVVRQLAALLHVLDSDIQVRALQGHSHLSSVLRFSVRGHSGPLSGSRLVSLLRNQLLREKSDYLLFRVLRVDTVLCFLRCSGRGQCDPITKQCSCDPFWTENLVRRYLGDGESNCEWRVLYVILTCFLLVVLILSASWTFICCCKRRKQTKVRKKTKYTILDNMDEQERVELRPKFSIKHRSTEHNSSLMMSESELDSDQDTIFSWDRPVRSRNRLHAQAACNGNALG
ncbi:dyslexia-associated protein KIAA0319 [Aulostomus maculatus]